MSFRVAVTVLMLSLASAPAVAQEPESDDESEAEAETEAEAEAPGGDATTERARELFGEGIALAGNADFAEAALRFREAYALVQAPNIAYNLAVALVELGEVSEAAELVQSILADDDAPADIRGLASGLAARIEGRLAHLRVSIAGDRGDATIHLDGETLPEEQLGESIALDPGDHVVTAERQGSILERQERTIDDGASVEITLDPSTWPGAAPDPVPVADEGGSILGKWWFWTIIGVVVVGAVVIGVAAASGGTEGPLDGNTSPAVVRF